HAAAAIGVDVGEVSGAAARVDDAELAKVLGEYDERRGRLEALEATVTGTQYAFVVRDEIERTDVARQDYFAALRRAIPTGDLRATAELQRVATLHRDSKDEPRHLVSLA